MLLSIAQGLATPLYSVRAGNACDVCHIEPVDWANPEISARRCTLDCNVCHESPTGSGLRTPAGQYYGLQVLPTWGRRPTAAAVENNAKPQKARFRLWEGFSGWKEGNTPAKEIPGRFGDIDPGEFDGKSVFRMGADVRSAYYHPFDDDRDTAFFPMQAEAYLMYRPSTPITLYSSFGLKGSKTKLDYTGNDTTEEDGYGYDLPQDYLTIPELFLKLDRFKYNSYIRMGRFYPVYGWRLPDHTSFIRRDLGFDNNRQVFGVEAGLNPNYPFLNVSAFVQGAKFWPGDLCWREDEDCEHSGAGATLSGGYRDIGGQIFGSFHYLNRNHGPEELTGGLGWGLNLFPAVYMGEADYRRTIPEDDNSDPVNALFLYNEIDFLAAKGANLKLKHDWKKENLNQTSGEAHRITVGIEWHPYSHVQLEAQHRTNIAKDDNGDFGVSLREALFIAHLWF